ncbi:MAG: VRR-NUC domain-containing protein [Huintestinicola sp.]
MTPEEYNKIAARAVSEETEQIHLMIWCRFMQTKFPELETIYHIVNEGKRTTVTGGKLKEMGLRKGMPDLHLPVSRCTCPSLYIEMKKIGGKPTAEQIDCLELLERYGNAVAICEGAEQAEKVLTAYCSNDIDTLKHLTLSSERGDFEKFRTPKRGAKKKRSVSPVWLILAVLQLTVMVAEILTFGTITGRSMMIPLAVVITALYTEMRLDNE